MWMQPYTYDLSQVPQSARKAWFAYFGMTWYPGECNECGEDDDVVHVVDDICKTCWDKREWQQKADAIVEWYEIRARMTRYYKDQGPA